MRRKTIGLIFMLMYFSSTLLFATSNQELPITDRKERMRRIFLQGGIINQGTDFARAFKFDLAFQKYLEATQSQYLKEETDKSFPLSLLSDLYRELGKCQEALDVLSWHEEHLNHPRSQAAINEKKAYLKACVSWQKTGDKKPIYDFIKEYKTTNKDQIPPKRADNLVMSRVAELYDLIGDYDASIAWVKMFRKADKSEPLKRTRSEYDSLIQAFEESKRGMPKVCSDDGKYCVGRATACIIRSKYF